MKTKIQILFILMIIFSTKSFSQDTLKTKEIDDIVKSINQSKYQIEKDTLIQDKPEYGLKTITYLTMVTNQNQLKKYENLVDMTMSQNGTTRKMITSSTFYYNQNKLIKVEEYAIEGNDKKVMDWYYFDGKPLYYTLKSDKAADRALFLITLSETMLKAINK